MLNDVDKAVISIARTLERIAEALETTNKNEVSAYHASRPPSRPLPEEPTARAEYLYDLQRDD